MSAKDLRKLSKTDWAKVDALADAEIDTSEGLLDEDFFRRAELRSPKERETTITLVVDADVLAWFRTQDNYEARVNAALKLYAEAHKGQH